MAVAQRASEALLAVLCVNDRVPRRAVLLPDGRLGDKVAHPTAAEVDVLSRVCEIVRAEHGVACQPRQTADLLERALATNCPGAWHAVKDDLVTGDLDMEAACAVLQQSCNPAMLLACLVAPRDAEHMMHVACLVARVLDRLSEEARAEMGRALAHQLRGLMDALIMHGAMMTREVVDGVADGFGRIIGSACAVPDARVAELVGHAIARRKDELLRLFLHVPPSFVDHDPDLVAKLLERAKYAAPLHKYPTMAMLSRIAAARPTLIRGHEVRVMAIVRAALPEQLDCRECMAAATLALAAAEGEGFVADAGMVKALARALRQCSGALVACADVQQQPRKAPRV